MKLTLSAKLQAKNLSSGSTKDVSFSVQIFTVREFEYHACLRTGKHQFVVEETFIEFY